MKLLCFSFVLGVLQLAILGLVTCDAPSSVIRYLAAKDDIPRVKIKVFRGSDEERNGETFATWGYWIKQPGG